MLRVIIPNQSDERILNLLDSFVDAGLSKYQHDIEVIVSLNNPSPEMVKQSKSLVDKYGSQLVVIETSQGGIAIAKNHAIQKYIETTDFFLFIDSDCEVAPDYFEILMDNLSSTSADIIRGGVDFVPEQDTLFSRLNCYLRDCSYVMNPLVALSPNLVMSTDVIKKTGLFNTKMLAGEDMEFHQRTREHDFTVKYMPELCVVHKDDPNFFRKTTRTMWLYGRDRGFRITRRLRLKQLNMLETVAWILQGQKYWKGHSKSSFWLILFTFYYLLISRLGTLFSITHWRKYPDNYFLDVEMLDGSIRKISSIPKEPDLP